MLGFHEKEVPRHSPKHSYLRFKEFATVAQTSNDKTAVATDEDMDIKDSPMKGGLSILHTVKDGKHYYEVEKVLKFKKACPGGGAFARNGDMLLKINDVDLEGVAPEDFAKMLAEKNPMLTIHPACQPPPPEICQEPGVLQPFSKEDTTLSFSLEMKREEDLKDMEFICQQDTIHTQYCDVDGHPPRDNTTNENVSKVDDDDDNLILVAMTNTVISVIRGRGSCDGKPCNISEVVMVAESSKITHVSKQTGNLENVKQWEGTQIEHFLYHLYIRSNGGRQAKPRLSANPEKITIYQYKSDCVDGDFVGVPVVLNFTNSNCFLKCVTDGEKVFLSVEGCDKHKLKSIKKDDVDILPYVFYMKAEGSQVRKFESAFCQGWFIHTLSRTEIVLGKPQKKGDQSFFFIIHK